MNIKNDLNNKNGLHKSKPFFVFIESISKFLINDIFMSQSV